MLGQHRVVKLERIGEFLDAAATMYDAHEKQSMWFTLTLEEGDRIGDGCAKFSFVQHVFMASVGLVTSRLGTVATVQ
jgi:hypothetical protein